MERRQSIEWKKSPIKLKSPVITGIIRPSGQNHLDIHESVNIEARRQSKFEEIMKAAVGLMFEGVDEDTSDRNTTQEPTQHEESRFNYEHMYTIHNQLETDTMIPDSLTDHTHMPFLHPIRHEAYVNLDGLNMPENIINYSNNITQLDDSEFFKKAYDDLCTIEKLYPSHYKNRTINELPLDVSYESILAKVYE
jgi:hypothetical protein